MNGNGDSRSFWQMIVLQVAFVLLIGGPSLAAKVSIVSVLDLKNTAGISDAEAIYLTDLARDALARSLPLQRFTIMTRESILELLPEGTRLSDCLDASCEVEIGRTLGADYVVSGEVLNFAGEQRFILKAHHCYSAAFLGSESAAGLSLKDVEKSVFSTTQKLAQRINLYGEPSPWTAPTPPTGSPVTSIDEWLLQPESFGVPVGGNKTTDLGLVLIEISAGSFLMGSPQYEENRKRSEDRHQVTLTKDFLISATEINQDQWYRVMATKPSRFEGANRPVENITFAQCIEFCNQLSIAEGLIPAYGKRNGNIYWNRESDGYRLPTEAEWEYSCRAGSQKRFANGDRTEDLHDLSWFRNNSTGRTHDVASKAPNNWGLHDMHGNVWEWCWNWSAAYPPHFATDPEGPSTGTSRVIRGGSWDNPTSACRSANHNGAKPGFHGPVLGFRVARSVVN